MCVFCPSLSDTHKHTHSNTHTHRFHPRTNSEPLCPPASAAHLPPHLSPRHGSAQSHSQLATVLRRLPAVSLQWQVLTVPQRLFSGLAGAAGGMLGRLSRPGTAGAPSPAGTQTDGENDSGRTERGEESWRSLSLSLSLLFFSSAVTAASNC